MNIIASGRGVATWNNEAEDFMIKPLCHMYELSEEVFNIHNRDICKSLSHE